MAVEGANMKIEILEELIHIRAQLDHIQIQIEELRKDGIG